MTVPPLPAPTVLRQRHQAFMAVEDLLNDAEPAHRYYGFTEPDEYWFDSGSGDEYRLVIVGEDALLTVFDHESPQSPWAREDQAEEWPGMFEGLPDHLRARLPDTGGHEHLSVSACFWFVDGAWRMGEPEPVPPQDTDFYAGDPGGANDLLGPLLHPEEEVRELVEDIYQQPERLAEALALVKDAS